eukprot:gnl/MRDRNA2_/MRDRNA2_132664_c0_seq1.p1 gnl/MRDRNA2_/MRDRNA2_132664_c0~~gnl/MRDRNA2_/MRDRNA2_132664_c0_seq1.p1  ORF type:complete len:270 (-),score=38.15 gnl/MRDRNA2_/MRDRNA2_132664_c0_seq1:63-872(-)
MRAVHSLRRGHCLWSCVLVVTLKLGHAVEDQHLGKLLLASNVFTGSFGLVKGIISIIGTVFALSIVWKLRRRLLFFFTGETRVNCAWQDIATCCGCCTCGAFGRYLGLNAYRIKITRLEIVWDSGARADLGAMDLYLKIHCGSNPYICTRVHNSSSAMTEVFTDTIHLNIRTTDGVFNVVLMEQDALGHDQLAKFDLNADDVVAWAQQDHVERGVESILALERKKGKTAKSGGWFSGSASSEDHALAAKLNIGFKVVSKDHDDSDDDWC